VQGKIEAGRWYDVKIELQGARIRCYLDGKLMHDVEDASPQTMAAVAGCVAATGDILLKVVNTTGEAQDTEVTLDGAGKVAPEGAALVLTSDDPNDENSFAQPTRVAPVALPAKGLGPSFRYTFLPHSLTILRMKAEKP
jgi:alpha-L-arabinofuranosidase